jgi:hypothetical protein
MPLLKLLEVVLNRSQALGRSFHLEVILLCDLDDNVHHIWEAATAAPHFVELVEDFGGNDQLPGILVEEAADHRFHVLGRDDVALANKHLQAPGWLRSARNGWCSLKVLGIDSCRAGRQGPGERRDYH